MNGVRRNRAPGSVVRDAGLGAVILLCLLAVPLLCSASALAAAAPTFSRADYDACLRASWVEPVDVTGDGRLDLVVCGEGDDSVVVLEGDGQGGFTFLRSVLSGGDGPYSLDVAELTGDGRDDVAVVNRWSKRAAVLAGDGHGAFTLLGSAAVGSEAIDVKAMDVDEDGDLDLVSCNMWTTNLNVLLNDGAGKLTRVDVPLPYKGATVLGHGDLDEDGHVDVVVGHYWGTTASVLLGDGDGGFTVTNSLLVGRYPTGAVVDDFNDDGHEDIIVASRYPNNANVFLGDGTGAFTGPTSYGVGPFAKVLAPADYNLDGRLDVAVCNWGADGVSERTVSMLTGRGDGAFDPDARIQVGDKPHSVATADLNGDGRPDLVTSNSATNDVTVLLNTTPFTQLDLTPPVTTAAAAGAGGQNGWWTGSPVTITLSATDAGGSGVAATRYRVDGAAWQTGAGFAVTGDGVHAVEYYSVDVAGNAEAVKSAQVRIDATAPAVSLTAPTDGAVYTQGSAVSAAWTATDPGGAAASGLAAEAATVDGQAIAEGARLDALALGAHDFRLTATDAAGNVQRVSARFTVAAVPSVFAVVTPNGGEALHAGAATTVSWSFGSPVSTGVFAVWAISEAGRWYGVGNATPDGTASYSVAWNVTVPAGRYRIRVSYGPQIGSWTATDYSDGYFTVGQGPTLTAPNGGETLRVGAPTTVTWTFGDPIETGVFAVWAISEAGRWYGVGNATPDGTTSYSTVWNVTVPAGRYRIRVSYGPQTGAWTASDYTDGYFTVAP